MTYPTLSHYSKEPLRTVYSCAQVGTEQKEYLSCFQKTTGLWVSVDGDDDWPTWCRENQFGTFGYRTVITLRDLKALLWLCSPNALNHFTDEYGVDEPWRQRHALLPPEGMERTFKAIEWDCVAQAYLGIIITPYAWQCRMSLSWYWGWDCASGCIWDATAIASLDCQPYTMKEEVEDAGGT